jgi:hypothetical protein
MANLTQIANVRLLTGYTTSTAAKAEILNCINFLDSNNIQYLTVNNFDRQVYPQIFSSVFGNLTNTKNFTDWPIVVWHEYYDDGSNIFDGAGTLTELQNCNFGKNINLVTGFILPEVTATTVVSTTTATVFSGFSPILAYRQ